MRAAPTFFLAGLLLAAAGCPPRGGRGGSFPPVRPVPGHSLKQLVIHAPDGELEYRWAAAGDLLQLGVDERWPYLYAGEPSLRYDVRGRRLLLAGKAVAVDISGLAPAAAAKLLARHAATIRSVVWRTAELDSAVVQALAALPATKLLLVLAAGSKAEAPLDLRGLAPLRSRLYGLILRVQIGAGGLAPLRELSALRLLRLELSLTRSDLEVVGDLARLTRLYLHDAFVGFKVGQPGLRAVGRLHRLEALYVSVNGLSDGALADLRGLTQLRTLDLGYNAIKGPGLVHLGALPRLARLDLGGNPLSGKALASVARLSNLEALHLRSTPIGDDDVGPLGRLPKLRLLDLQKTQVGDDGLQRLAGLSDLRALNLRNTLLSGDGLARVAGLKRLVKLDLARTQIKNTDLGHLRPLASLRVLDLSRTGVGNGVEGYLRALGKLRLVTLVRTRVSEAGLRAVKGLSPQLRVVPEPLPGGAARGRGRVGFGVRVSSAMGHPACDRVLRVMACIASRMPSFSARRSYRRMVGRMRARWMRLRRTASGRRLMGRSCSNQLRGLRSLRTSARFSTCF